MFRLSTVLLLALSLVAAACGQQKQPEEACNFVQNSQVQRVSWKDDVPVVLYFHKSVPPEFHDAMVSAANIWEQSLGRDLFEFRGVIDGPELPQKDGVSVIYWMTNWDSPKTHEQARTTIYWVGDQIRESDLRINADSRYFTYSAGERAESSKVDLESLVVHEFGHILGLQHNNENGSVMAESLAHGVLRRAPQEQDLASLSCEY